MKPKVSTGYFTPQAKKTKSKKTALSDHKEENWAADLNPQIFEALLQCPEKKKMVLQLLSLGKDAIKNYETNKDSVASPVDKLKNGKKAFESPTALMRRRALEQMNGSPSTSNRLNLTRSNSRLSESSSSSATSVSIDKILQGVIAYVEIKGRQNEDRSGGAKEILKTMGATVREKFTKDVTHVIFKSGSYNTFQKAKLLKVHLVSILWLEFSRKTLRKQDEKQYPAIGGGFEDESVICSQMHKEYEEMIREEYKRSIVQGTPLPTTRALIDRRRTLMTPSVTNNNAVNTSTSSYNTAISSQEISDREVVAINCLNNDIEEDLVDSSDMDLTNIHSNNVLKNPFKETQKYPYNNTATFDRRKTIGHSSFLSNSSPDKSKFEKRNSSNKSESFVFGKNMAKPKKHSTELDKTDSLISELKISEQSTSMSSLQISSDTNKKKPSSLMSSLQDLCEKHQNLKNKSNSFASSGGMANVNVLNAINLLDKESVCSESSDDSEIIQKSPKKNNKKAKIVELNSEANVSKELLVNLEKSSLCEEIQHKTRRRTLAARRKSLKALQSQRTTSESNERRKTLAPSHKLKVQNQNTTSDSSCNGLKLGEAKKTRKLISDSDTPKAGQSRRRKSDNVSSDGDSLKQHITADSDFLKSTKKLRKLYNPDHSINHIESIDDEKERQEKRDQLRKRKNIDQNVFENPMDVLHKINEINNISTTSQSEQEQENVTSRKRLKKTTKISEKRRPSFNSSDDEQKDLLEKVLNRKNNPTQTSSRRKSVRILNSQSAKKANTQETNIKVPVTPANRRSTMEFMSKSQISSRKKSNKKTSDKAKLPTIVCTKLHRSEVQVFSQIVKKLGKFVVEDEVSNRTTHIVVGEAKRTINMLKAIARGCWVVKYEWVLRSLEEGKWLPEENYEVDDFSSAVQKCRLERQAFGAKYTMDVFESCPPIYVTLGTNPRSSDLKELITTCKGKVVTVPRMARIIVGEYLNLEDKICVNETWVLDSITFYKRMPVKSKYLLQSINKRKSVAM